MLGLCVCLWLFVTLWTVALQAFLSMAFPRQEYWSGLPFPTPGNLSTPGINWVSCIAVRFFSSEPPGKPLVLSHLPSKPFLVYKSGQHVPTGLLGWGTVCLVVRGSQPWVWCSARWVLEYFKAKLCMAGAWIILICVISELQTAFYKSQENCNPDLWYLKI